MKFTLVIVVLLMLSITSCHKKHEENAGTFVGQETRPDTVLTTEYLLSYDKVSKRYSCESVNGNIPLIQFDKKGFNDNSVFIRNETIPPFSWGGQTENSVKEETTLILTEDNINIRYVYTTWNVIWSSSWEINFAGYRAF